MTVQLPTPCVVCFTTLEDAIKGESKDGRNQPYAGTCFTSSGHYGSTVYDPMSKYEWLSIVICDVCLVRLGKEGRVARIQETPNRSTFAHEGWTR